MTLTGLYVSEMCIYTNLEKIAKITNFHSYDTRCQWDLHLPVSRTNMSSRTPNRIGQKIYSRLLVKIRNIKSISYALKKMKTYFVDKCPYSIQKHFG